MRDERKKIMVSFLLGMVTALMLGFAFVYGIRGAGVLSAGKINYYKDLDAQYGKYYKMQKSIRDKSLYSIDKKKRDRYLSQAVIQSLPDPYAAYYNKEDYEKLERRYSESYSGIGISVEEKKGKLLIAHVIKDGPAEQGGLRKGDRILSVDGKKVHSVDDASDRIGGEAGTDVVLKLKRGGQDVTVTLTRQEVEEDSVDSKFLKAENGKKLGYIRIRHFREGTSEELKEAEERLMDGRVTGVVIDVRDNPGGIKDEGVKCADLLLPSGKILIEKNNQGKKKVARADGQCADFEYVVLVNGNTASAAEIFAGAVQVNRGGKLIGEKTYGKGVIQSVEKLEDGSAFKFTTEEYFLPDGTPINKKGIQPDIRVASGKALTRGIQMLSEIGRASCRERV